MKIIKYWIEKQKKTKDICTSIQINIITYLTVYLNYVIIKIIYDWYLMK